MDTHFSTLPSAVSLPQFNSREDFLYPSTSIKGHAESQYSQNTFKCRYILRFLKAFLAVFFFVISLFFISDSTKEIFTMTLTFYTNYFVPKKTKTDYIFVHYWKLRTILWHLSMFVLVWMFYISLPNVQASHVYDFIPLICCDSCFAQKDRLVLLETRNTTDWLWEKEQHMVS